MSRSRRREAGNAVLKVNITAAFTAEIAITQTYVGVQIAFFFFLTSPLSKTHRDSMLNNKDK